MSSKQQQKDLESIIIKNTERYIDYDEECPFESRRVAEPDELAKKILKVGYRKVSEDEIVISKKEYNRLKGVYDTEKELLTQLSKEGDRK